MAILSAADVTPVILAGGLGRRAGGPKSFRHFRGEPILGRLHRQIDWPTPALLVTAGTVLNPPGHNLFKQIVDRVEDQGPLRGILTALENSNTAWVFITTVDMPDIDRSHIDWLMTQVSAASTGVLTRDPETGDLQPFPCLLHTSLKPEIERLFGTHHLAARGIATLPGVITPSSPPWFADAQRNNLNTAAEWTASQAREAEPEAG